VSVLSQPLADDADHLEHAAAEGLYDVKHAKAVVPAARDARLGSRPGVKRVDQGHSEGGVRWQD
jgi:hypothetical protein